MVKEKGGERLACFFDSGIGGLPLLAECYKRRKDCNFAYFADNYNMPYGNLSPAQITERADAAFGFMACLKPSVAVVACNTVTAGCIEYLRAKYPFPIVGTQPAVKPAAAERENCIVLATCATASSRSLIGLVEKFGRSHTQILPCPDLAGYIENNVENLDKEEIFSRLPKTVCDGVILGCTHYSYAAEVISEFYSAPVYDNIAGVANRFEKILGNSDHQRSFERNVTFYGGNFGKNATVFNFLLSKN